MRITIPKSIYNCKIIISLGDRNDMYISEIRHFLKCVKDRKKTINTIDEGIETMKIALAMKKSSESRRMINI